MSLIVIDMAPIVAHLQASGTDFKAFGQARDLGSAKAATIAYPSAFLIPLSERAGEQLFAHGVGTGLEQRVTFNFGVLMALTDIGDRAGNKAMGAVPRHRSQIMTALAAFLYPEADDICLPAGGRLISSIDHRGRLFWQDDYRIPYHRRIDGGS